MNLKFNLNQTKLLAWFPYNMVEISKMRTIPGARYRPTDKAWVLPKDINTVIKFKQVFPHANIEPRIQKWETDFFSRAHDNMATKNEMKGVKFNIDFKTTPYKHQELAFGLCADNEQFALFHEMGTGKTWVMVNIISYFRALGSRAPTLVICPLSVCSVWESQIKIHSNDLSSQLLTGSRYERIKALRNPVDVFIINYEGLRIIKEQLLDMEFGVVICDESQRIKNRTAQQSKIACQIGQRAGRRYILTGTPIVNNPLDSFGQFKFLNEEILGSNYFAFQNRYAIMVTNGKARFPVRFVNTHELAGLIAPWSHRVMKQDCLDLPDKVYETRHVDLPAPARKIYKELAINLVAQIGDKLVTAPIILTKLLRFSQLTAGFAVDEKGDITEVSYEKINILGEILDEAMGKVVVWTKFHKEMDMVCRALDKRGVGYVTLSGKTPQKDRERNLQRFRDDDGVRVFVSQLEAGGVGIDLTAAATCVYMSNSYSLGTRAQSEDRLHRIGQKNNVTYIDIICANTIDQKILKILRDKKNLADIINGDIDRHEFIQNLVSMEEENGDRDSSERLNQNQSKTTQEVR